VRALGPRGMALLLLVLLVACALGGAVHTLDQRSQASLAKSEQALAIADMPEAIGWARDAAMAWRPGSVSVDSAYQELVLLAARAEERGDWNDAIAAWRAVLEAMRSTRREGGMASQREEAQRALVRIAAKACQESQTRPPATCAAAAQASFREESLPELPRFAWVGLGGIAFLLGALGAAKPSRGRWASWALALSGLGAVGFGVLTP